MLSINFPGVSKDHYVAMLAIHTSISNFRMSNIKFDVENTELTMHTNKPQLTLSLQNGGFEMKFSYRVFSTPELLDDEGTGRAWIKALNITAQANPTMKNGMVELEFDELNIGLDDIGLDLIGGDLSMVVDSLS